MAYGNSYVRGEKRKREEKEGMEMLGVGATVARLNGEQDQADAGAENKPSREGSKAVQGEKRPNEDVDDGGEWQTVERSKKRQKKENANYPAILHASSARLQSSVKINDLQNLVLYLLADGNGPQWISVRHKKEIERVVCLLVPGLEADMFNGNIDLAAEETNKANALDALENKIDGQLGQQDAKTFAASSTAAQDVKTNVVPSTKATRKDKHYQNPDDYYPTKLIADKLPASLSPLADVFSHIWPVKTPGDYNRMHSPLYAMLNSPIPKQKEDKKIKGPKPPNVGKDFQSKRTPVTEFLATKEDLTENNFSIHPVYLQDQEERDFEAARRHKNCRSPEDGWIDLPEDLTDIATTTTPFEDIEAGSMTAGRNVLFLDCEMVTTKMDKFALARVSLLNWNGEVVMDELVQPPDPVTDYLTQYSGISKEMLDPVTTTLTDIHTKLKTLLTPRTILAGHSLDSDLRALKISFPFIVDTTLLYPHPKGPPQKSSLKWLTQKYLSREIQNRGPQGHDSIEDARACLDLVKQKCEKGKSWGTSEATGESIFKRLSRSSDEQGRTGAVVDWGDPRKGYGASATVSIPCETDADVVAGVRRVACGPAHPGLTDAEIAQCVLDEIPRNGVDFTWARLRELEALRGWWNRTKSADAAERLAKTLGSSLSDPTTEDAEIDGEMSTSALAAAVASTVANIKRIYDSLPPKTAFIVYSGSGDPRDLRRLSEMQVLFKRAYQTTKWDELPVQWTDVEEQGLKAAAAKARSGIGFVVCK